MPTSARLARPPLTAKQSASESRRTGLSITTPKSAPDRHTRGQSGANAQVRREPVEDYPTLVSTDSEQLPYISKPARMRRFCAKAIFSLGPSTAHSLFVKNKKRMGVECSGYRRIPPRRRAVPPIPTTWEEKRGQTTSALPPSSREAKNWIWIKPPALQSRYAARPAASA